MDIRIGFKNQKVALFVGDDETNLYNLDQRIKEFLTGVEDWRLYDIGCRLFVDEGVTCDHTFFVLNNLIANDIRRIRFITETDKYNPLSSDFRGISLSGIGGIRPLYNVNFVEKNEH